MRSFALKLALLGVAAMGVTALAATSASAVEETGATCASSSATATLSPGVEEGAAKVQNITIKGTLGECTGSAGSSAKLLVHVKTAAPVTCAMLNGEGALAEGTGILKWGHGHGNSQGAFSLSGTVASASLSGALESGPYAGMKALGTFAGTPVFKGKGEACTKKNKLKRIELTGTSPLAIS
ncbi:MAG TPA: hypothetical protein VK774_02045 [Solirubrobacteraceae bacterium]|jgi:hypothetical protein|nr:hypothetical protein [Solirubrobacteraceae bacterium]